MTYKYFSLRILSTNEQMFHIMNTCNLSLVFTLLRKINSMATDDKTYVRQGSRRKRGQTLSIFTSTSQFVSVNDLHLTSDFHGSLHFAL